MKCDLQTPGDDDFEHLSGFAVGRDEGSAALLPSQCRRPDHSSQCSAERSKQRQDAWIS